MNKLRYLIIVIVIAIISYFGWMVTKSKPLDHIPEKAKLVIVCKYKEFRIRIWGGCYESKWLLQDKQTFSQYGARGREWNKIWYWWKIKQKYYAKTWLNNKK